MFRCLHSHLWNWVSHFSYKIFKFFHKALQSNSRCRISWNRSVAYFTVGNCSCRIMPYIIRSLRSEFIISQKILKWNFSLPPIMLVDIIKSLHIYWLITCIFSRNLKNKFKIIRAWLPNCVWFNLKHQRFQILMTCSCQNLLVCDVSHWLIWRK